MAHEVDAQSHVIDYAVGAGGITSPAWLTWLHTINEVISVLAAFGGLALLVLRLGMAVREWNKRCKQKGEE